MNKYLSILICWTLGTSVVVDAQQVKFDVLQQSAPFNLSAELISMRNGKNEFIDIDFDGDQDIYLSNGATLYLNDGKGNFALKPLNINPLYYCSHAIADFNGDGFLDLFQSGLDTNGEATSEIYRGDSLNRFAKVLGNSFIGLGLSYTDFADIDGDSDLDIMLLGQDSSRRGTTLLYLNQGNMAFTKSTAPFPNLSSGSVNFQDIDGDTDMDLLLTGRDFGVATSKLFRNDGSGNFTEIQNTSLEQLEAGVAHFFDSDNDGDKDLVITGRNNSNTWFTDLYKNDGTGVFAKNTSFAFEPAFDGSVSSGYINQDSLLDLVVTGLETSTQDEATNVYINIGSNQFRNDTLNQLIGVARGATDFADVNADGFQDLLLMGETDFSTGTTGLFLNNGTGRLTEITGSGVTDIVFFNSELQALDYDQDGLTDLLVSGRTVQGRQAEFYKNNGAGRFTADPNARLPIQSISNSIAADFNNDGYPDILIAGFVGNFSPVVQLYFNDLNGGFTLSATPFDSLHSVVFGYFDSDNNGFKDIVISGSDKQGSLVTRLYKSNSSGTYQLATSAGIRGFYAGSMDNTDVDNDGDQDLVITGTGYNSNNNRQEEITELYINSGNGSFTKLQTQNLEQVANSTAGFADMDKDGDFDLVVVGRTFFSQRKIDLYLNDGQGNFSSYSSFDLLKTQFSTLDIFDVDGDSLLDIFLTGIDENGNRKSAFYIQFDTLDFRMASTTPFDGFVSASTIAEDFDGDNLVDILVSGANQNFKEVTKLYLNKTCQLGFSNQSIVACGYLNWIDGNNYYSGFTNRRFRIQNSDSSACDSIIFLDLTITPSTLSNSILLKNDTLFSLDTNSLSIKQWINCSANGAPVQGANSNFFVLPNNDSYALTLKNGACTDTSDCISLVGLKTQKLRSPSLGVRPNPNRGIFKLKSSIYGVNANLYTVEGAFVKLLPITQEVTSFDLSSIPKGVYILRIENAALKLIIH